MKVVKVDGLNKQYIFEDGTKVDFSDKKKYRQVKNGNVKSDKSKTSRKRRYNSG